MENMILYVFCSVVIIPILSKLLWSSKGLKRYFKKIYKYIKNKLCKKHVFSIEKKSKHI